MRNRRRRILFESPETNITREGAMQAFMALRVEAKKNGLTDMGLEEINAEIAKVRVGAES